MKKRNREIILIYGKVTDFNRKPIANAIIDIMDDNFQSLY